MEANTFANGQGAVRLLWNRKFHYRANKSQPLAPYWFRGIQSTLPHRVPSRPVL